MGLRETISRWFRKGGAAVGMVESLTLVTDHPKINIDASEYRRINEALTYYKGTFPNEIYKNFAGKEQERKFYDLNMTEVIAKYMASLVINENCEITVNTLGDVEGEKDLANEFTQEVLKANHFIKNLAKYLEPMFGLGGLAARPYVDPKSKEIKFVWAMANTFYPLRSNTNTISECAIVSTTTQVENKKTYYYTLFEFHEWMEDGNYRITNELYESETQGIVGIRVSLSRVYKDMSEEAILENLSRPTFSYVKPFGFNNINPYSPLGLGVADNCKKVLEQINRTNNQMEWDMYKAKPRVLASQHFAKVEPSENGVGFETKFDDESEEFIFGNTDQEYFVQDISFKFSPQEYIDKINFHFRMLEKKSQLSLGTFSYDGNEGIKTATEVVSEDSETFRTRNSQITEISQFIKELVITICELGRSFDIYEGPIPTYEQIGVNFDDGIFTDKNSQLEYFGKAKTFGFIPDVEAMIRVFGIPKEEAESWFQMIKKQDGLSSDENDSQLDKLEKERYPAEY